METKITLRCFENTEGFEGQVHDRMDLAGRTSSKESACNARDVGSIPRLGRSPGGGYGNPLQYSCLENPIDRGACRATVHSVAKSWTQLKQLSTYAGMGMEDIYEGQALRSWI